ncbi:MAG: rhomboid family intramembrane serine protease [Nitrososphaerales archaeon]
MWTPVTMALLAINILVFIAGYLYEDTLYEFAVIPAQILRNPSLFVTSSLSSMFLHAGVVHIAFNMIALTTLGRVLEPHIGSKRFTIVYFASGFAGTALHTAYVLATGNGINTPVVGASGAISGIIGIAAALGDRLAIFWLVAQVPFAVFGGSSIAYFAHIGGFILGFVAGRIMKYLTKRRKYTGDYYT